MHVVQTYWYIDESMCEVIDEKHNMESFAEYTGRTQKKGKKKKY